MAKLRTALLGLLICLFCLLLSSCGGRPAVSFASGIDHQAYQSLLEHYVDAQGLVDYRAWRKDPAAVAQLDSYLASYATAPNQPALGSDRQAGLLNLYNALTIRAVLRLDPSATSFWEPKPFARREHQVGGLQVSLDDIEHGACRPEIGYRAHAGLVCAAISCPPLPREAFTADQLDQQLDERMRIWLARNDLNQFDADNKTAKVSKIFSWFSGDFTDPGLPAILKSYAPPEAQSLLAGEYQLSYLDYDKGLNQQP